MRFVAYDAATDANVVVDGSPNDATVLTLSHWPGMESPPTTWADTSAEMVLRYLDTGADLHGDADVVTKRTRLLGRIGPVDVESRLDARHQQHLH